MNKTWKKKWIKALLSGDYKQGRRSLRNWDNSSYCCLGVLCDIFAPDRWSEATYGKHLGSLEQPAFIILKETNLTDDNISELVYLNDDSKDSFHDIANWIDGNL